MSKERIMLLPPRMMASWRSSEEISLLKLSDTVKESGRIIRSVAIDAAGEQRFIGHHPSFSSATGWRPGHQSVCDARGGLRGE